MSVTNVSLGFKMCWKEVVTLTSCCNYITTATHTLSLTWVVNLLPIRLVNNQGDELPVLCKIILNKQTNRNESSGKNEASECNIVTLLQPALRRYLVCDVSGEQHPHSSSPCWTLDLQLVLGVVGEAVDVLHRTLPPIPATADQTQTRQSSL